MHVRRECLLGCSCKIGSCPQSELPLLSKVAPPGQRSSLWGVFSLFLIYSASLREDRSRPVRHCTSRDAGYFILSVVCVLIRGSERLRQGGFRRRLSFCLRHYVVARILHRFYRSMPLRRRLSVRSHVIQQFMQKRCECVLVERCFRRQCIKACYGEVVWRRYAQVSFILDLPDSITSRELNTMALPFKPVFPWLLYAYPWMPYPRRVIIYFREKGIPESLVQVVHVSDPQDGNKVFDPASFHPRPVGSLPILAIPSETIDDQGKPKDWVYIRQSMAMINYLEELCNTGQYGFSSPHGPLMGKDGLARARVGEVLSLAEECTIAWYAGYCQAEV